jgi:carbon starvation protein
MVSGWGYFLLQGVRDPLGGINSLWPLFGVANQMLAAIALCLGTTVILKFQLSRPEAAPGQPAPQVSPGRPALALVTVVPMVWLLAVTWTAGAQKIFHSDPRIGFLAQVRVLDARLPELEQARARAEAGGDAGALAQARGALKVNRTLRFNNRLDAVVAGTFLMLVGLIVLMSVREWVLLLARKRLARLHETAPVWLPDYAVVEGRPGRALGLLALAFGLVRELSGEAQLERAREAEARCCVDDSSRERQGRLYAAVTEARYSGVRRCC